MRRIILLFGVLIFTAPLFAQAPQGINYQGVARDPFGNAIPNTNILVGFSILQSSTTVYQENQSVLTDTFGLYSLVIGAGTPILGTFNSIPWSGGNLSLRVDLNGSTVATMPLQSVPYALYAASSGSGGGGTNISGTANNIPRINNGGNGLGRSLIFQSADSSSIGINNATPLPEALLDMVSTTKGLLIPRMTDAQRNAIPVSSLQHGLLVFQTNNASIISPQGFWYYDAISSAWLLVAPAQAVWTLAGNAVGTNGFLGSLDDKDLIFKTGFITPTERMRVLSNANGGNIQFGSTPTTSYKFPTAKGNPGQVLQLDSSGITNNLYWKNLGGGGGPSPWISSGGLIFQNNLSDTVGIGTNTPRTTLEIASTNTNGALNASNNGAQGGAGVFSVLNSANDSTALVAYTKGKGAAFLAVTQGTSHAGGFGILNSSSNACGVFSTTNGTGRAVFGYNDGLGYGGLFVINNAANDSAAVAGFSIGKGPSVVGYNTGLGNAGVFQIANSANSHNALDANTNGAGRAGFFQISNPANNSQALSVSTNGTGGAIDATSSTGSAISAIATTGSAVNAANSGGGNTVNSVNSGGNGSAGNFQINNNANGNPALHASTSGGGSAIEGSAAGNGAALYGNHSGSGAAVVGYNSGTGMAGSFNMVNPTSNADALFVSTSSAGGFSGHFTGGKGLQTDKIQITSGLPQAGFVLSSGSTSGDGNWVPLPSATNFGTTVSATAQTLSPSTTATVNLGTPAYQNGGAGFSGNFFVAPSNGIYHFDVQITVNNQNTMSGGVMVLTLFEQTTNTSLKQIQYNLSSGGTAGTFFQPLVVSADIPLTANQKVAITIANTSTGTNYQIVTNPLLSWFNGHKVF